MLQSMREGAHSKIIKFVLFGLLMLAMIGLAVMDIGGFFRGGNFRNEVARIGGERITVTEFDQTVRRILSRQGIPPDQAYRAGLIDQILLNEARSRLLMKAASDLGLRVSDDVVARELQQLVAPYVTKDTTPQQALDRILQTQNISEAVFVSSLKQEISRGLLTRALEATAIVPASLVDALYRQQKESRSVDYIIFPEAGAAQVGEPTEENLQEIYERQADRYALPETRTFTVAIMQDREDAGSADIPEDELKAYYDENADLFTAPETRTVRQAVLKDRATAEEVLGKIKEGGDIREAVKAVTGSESAYLGEDKLEKAGLPEAVGGPVFAAAKGDTVGPVETPLGWHILTISEIAPESVTPFGEAKDRLRADMAKERAADQLIERVNEFDDSLASGATLEDLEQDFGLRFQQVGPVDLTGQASALLEDIGEEDRARIWQQAFALQESESAPLFELADGRFATVRLDRIAPKAAPPMADIRDRLAADWRAKQLRDANMSRATAALARLRDDEASLAQIAETNRLGAVQHLTKVTRDGEPPAPFTVGTADMLLATAQGSYDLVASENGVALFQVTSIDRPDPARMTAAERELLTRNLSQTIAAEIVALYLEDTTRKSPISVNRQVLDRMYGGTAGEEG